MLHSLYHFFKFNRLLLLTCLCLTTSSLPNQPQLTSTLIIDQTPIDLAPNFLGVAIDAAMLTDGNWWKNSNTPPKPINLNDPQLLYWSKLLQPAIVRLGGSEADLIWLPGTPAPADLTHSILDYSTLMAFLTFVKRVDSKALITVNSGPLTRVHHQWQPQQLEQLLQWLPNDFQGHFEFGNELNAHWLMFGPQAQVSMLQYSQEYQQARKLIQTRFPNSLLAGPANAFWPYVGEPLSMLTGSSKTFLQQVADADIFSWHYYPTQSARCGLVLRNSHRRQLISRDSIQSFQQQAEQINQWRQQFATNTPIWLGETGPTQCGGHAANNQSFISSLWWLAQIATAAQNRQSMVIRQALFGGDYALLPFEQQYYPNAHYWAQLMWQQLVGERLYRVQILPNNKDLFAVAFCSKGEHSQTGLLLINLNDRAVKLQSPFSKASFIEVASSSIRSEYTLIQQILAEHLDWPQQQWRTLWQAQPTQFKLDGYRYRWLINDEPGCQL